MKRLLLPMSAVEVKTLEAGEGLLLTGPALGMRDAALQRLSSLTSAGEPPPFSLEGELVFHVGPSPPAAGRAAGAAGPTTAARMDDYLELLFSLGVLATLGKGPRSNEAAELHARHGTVYLASVGGAGALLARSVESLETLAWEDLGPEAVYSIGLKDMPCVVAIDSGGSDFLREEHARYRR